MTKMRRQLLVVAIAALLVTPMGAVMAQNNTTDDGEDDPDQNASVNDSGDLPDLEVDDLRVMPEEARPGDEVRFVAQLANDGDANASAFNVSFDVDGEQHSVARVDGLDSEQRTQVTSEPWNASEGEHEVTVLADSADEVSEEDEENNAESEEFDVEAEEREDPDDRDRDRDQASEERSDWNVDNGTYTGEYIQVTVDEELPGLVDVNYLDPNASVFDSVALPAGNLSYHAAQDVLAGETERGEFAVSDADGGHLMVETDDDNVSVELAISDGVTVEENETYSEEDEPVYKLDLEANETAWLFGEDVSYANGTFTVNGEAHLAPTFPPSGEDADEREDRREEMRERMEERREERREAGSQWDRSNQSFEGDHVAFNLSDDESGIEDYAIVGSLIPVFAEASLPSNDTEWRAHGQSFEIRTDDARLRVLDVPPAVLIAEADDGAQTRLVLAEGVTVERLDRDADNDTDDEDDDAEDRAYKLSLAENRTAWVIGEDTSYENGTFLVQDRAIFRTVPTDPEASENRGPGSLPDEARDRDDEDERGPPDQDERGPPEDRGRPAQARAHALDDRARMQVEQALAEGKVAAEIHVGPNTTEPVAVEMANVQVKKAWAARANDSSLAGMTIEAPDDSPGTTVTMTLAAEKLGNVSIGEAGDRLGVEYDNETIPIADDLEDVLNPNDDNGTAEYLLLVGGDEVQILVSVPHFSPHTIEVYETQSSEQVAANGAPGFGALSMIAATSIAAMALAARKHE